MTNEVREGGRRVGFLIRTFPEGREGFLASIRFRKGPRIGRYFVDLETFEHLGVRSLRTALSYADLIIIDEIGPMELLSNSFKQSVIDVLDSDKPVLATIHYKARHQSFGRMILNRDDIMLYVLNMENREYIYREIAEKILETINFKSLNKVSV